YVLHPFDFLGVLFNTLTNAQITNFYTASFFGILGWLDTSIGQRNVQILTFSFMAMGLASLATRQWRIEAFARISLVFISIIALLLVFFLLLITWNPHPSSTIAGVQGRYFWAPVILLGYGLTTSWSNL